MGKRPLEIAHPDRLEHRDRFIVIDAHLDGGDNFGQAAHGLFCHSRHQRGLVAKVAKGRSSRDTGAFCGFAHTGFFGATFFDKLNRCINQRFPQVAMVIGGRARRFGFWH